MNTQAVRPLYGLFVSNTKLDLNTWLIKILQHRCRIRNVSLFPLWINWPTIVFFLSFIYALLKHTRRYCDWKNISTVKIITFVVCFGMRNKKKAIPRNDDYAWYFWAKTWFTSGLLALFGLNAPILNFLCNKFVFFFCNRVFWRSFESD